MENFTNISVYRNLYLRILRIDNYATAYVLPIFISQSVIGNSFVCWIMLKSSKLKSIIWPHIRIYYFCFAFGDMNLVLSYYLSKYLGMICIDTLDKFKMSVAPELIYWLIRNNMSSFQTNTPKGELIHKVGEG